MTQQVTKTRKKESLDIMPITYPFSLAGTLSQNVVPKPQHWDNRLESAQNHLWRPNHGLGPDWKYDDDFKFI